MTKEYKFQVYGRGGEIVVGTISKETYDYWEDKDDELDCTIVDLCNDDFDPEEYGVDEDMMPFEPGDWYDCDNIIHEFGATADDMSELSIYDSEGNQIFRTILDPEVLKETNIQTELLDEVYVDDLDDGTCVFMATDLQKGTFFGGTFEVEGDFDPTKLKIKYCDADGWFLVTELEYDDEELYNTDMDTFGKGFDANIKIVGE